MQCNAATAPCAPLSVPVLPDCRCRCSCCAAADDWFLFMYTCKTGQVVRFTSDNNFIPMWNSPWPPIDNMCTAFSAMGSAAILPLRPSKGYEFEVAIFGGGTQVSAITQSGFCSVVASDAQQTRHAD